ncbi:MAG: hypothetical protein ABL958_08745 [Bdellovibrionia bacterium]
MKLANLSFIAASLVLGFGIVANAQWNADNANVKVEHLQQIKGLETPVIVTRPINTSTPYEGWQVFYGEPNGEIKQVEVAQARRTRDGGTPPVPAVKLTPGEGTTIELKNGGYVYIADPNGTRSGHASAIKFDARSQPLPLEATRLDAATALGLIYDRGASAHNAIENSKPAEMKSPAKGAKPVRRARSVPRVR